VAAAPAPTELAAPAPATPGDRPAALPAPAATAPATIPAPPDIPVKGYILTDQATGTVLAEREADTRLEPASLTKILAVYVVGHELAAGHIRLTDTVRVSELAWKTPGSRMFIQPDLPVTVDQLLHGIAVQSGNDASVALAEHTAGSSQAFVDLMNAHAARLGMTGSHFSNPDGLPDPGNYTTARDMALLARALIREFPDLHALFGLREYSYNGITQPNRNKLLYEEPGADGVKTGYTEAAGYCLVGTVKRDDMRLISVVMGAASDGARTSASRALLNYGFRFFETHRLYAAGQELQKVQVWLSGERELPVTVAEDLHVTVPRGQYAGLSASMELTPRLVAPIAAGTPVGKVRVTLGDRLLLERDVVLGSEAKPGGFLRWIIDSTLMWVY
jgi:D-alanyl-D-alanine carboxypeptidase (penicillin-binding protein 5/6)